MTRAPGRAPGAVPEGCQTSSRERPPAGWAPGGPQPGQSPGSKTVAILPAWFFGWPGFRRFRVGRFVPATLTRPTPGGLGTWRPADFIPVRAGRPKDSDSLPVSRPRSLAVAPPAIVGASGGSAAPSAVAAARPAASRGGKTCLAAPTAAGAEEICMGKHDRQPGIMRSRPGRA
ncbi:MAG: TM2 domain-containing protein [Deltaproteobacteria bacterium]|nr:TM2 domain-containing protein [Deltaproteobacteria bacterium]